MQLVFIVGPHHAIKLYLLLDCYQCVIDRHLYSFLQCYWKESGETQDDGNFDEVAWKSILTSCLSLCNIQKVVVVGLHGLVPAQ